MSHRIAPLVVAVCSILGPGAWDALGQGTSPTGTPLPTFAFGTSQLVVVAAECQDADESGVLAAGGATLLVSSSPGGPLTTSVFDLVDTADPCPAFATGSVPPGTYWLLWVVGNTTTATAPAAFWGRVVVDTSACTAPPGVPRLAGGAGTGGVSLSLSGVGCAWTQFELQAGTSPGASNLGTFTTAAPQMTFAGVPAGLYYLRARALNAYGASRWSLELPVRVPGCGMGDLLPQAPLGPSVTVGVGSLVTLTWSHTTLEWLTFHQIAIKTPSGEVADTIVLPASTTSVSAPVPAGAYRIGILSGGPCGRSAPVTGDLIFTVP